VATVTRSTDLPVGSSLFRKKDSCGRAKRLVLLFISDLQKSLLTPDPNQLHLSAVPSRKRGVAQRHETWGGMRWTRMVLLTRALEADGEDVWS